MGTWINRWFEDLKDLIWWSKRGLLNISCYISMCGSQTKSNRPFSIPREHASILMQHPASPCAHSSNSCFVCIPMAYSGSAWRWCLPSRTT